MPRGRLVAPEGQGDVGRVGVESFGLLLTRGGGLPMILGVVIVRRGVVTALAVGAALVLGACGESSTSGAARGAELVSSGETSAPTVSTSRMAPPVPDPRDARGVQDPCQDLLTAEQLAALGFDQPGEQKTIVDVQACTWQDRGYNQELTAYVDTENDVLSAAYRDKGNFQAFKEIEIAGLPAVQGLHTPDSASCYLTVGLADTQGLEVTYTLLRPGKGGDPCDGGRKAAEAIVGNLPALK